MPMSTGSRSPQGSCVGVRSSYTVASRGAVVFSGCEGDCSSGSCGVLYGVGGVLALSARSGEDAGAVSAVDCPEGVDARSDAGLRALEAGFV